ncbi:hypothetical protein [Paractinoplanes hotanensis]|uniref:Uncharacterized protein n=1 Tax=Paractinoplanes hotanensis TaxID=2906497 RepID=A0ABT0YGW3_9ACTN|nr:hypothetical protein [Actinoplanes hotanensis]MCM4084737.1 hypothetical protein [Actinoplanes hotanensis]
MSEEWRPPKLEPGGQSADEAGPGPALLAPKAFKPIPADRPARELGEYLRELIRSTKLTLERTAQKSGLPKSTMSTTVNGTAKGRQSVQDLLDALAAVGRELTTEELDKVWQLYEVGRRNLIAQQEEKKARQRADAPMSRSVVQPTAQDITVFAHAVVGGMTITSTSIELPRRVPGEHLQLTRSAMFRQTHGVEDDGGYRRRINLTRIDALNREGPTAPSTRAARTLPSPRPVDAREEVDLEDWISSLGRAYRRPNDRYAALAVPESGAPVQPAASAPDGRETKHIPDHPASLADTDANSRDAGPMASRPAALIRTPRDSADDVPTAARPAPIALADSTPPVGRPAPLALADPDSIAAGSAPPVSSTPGARPTPGRRIPLRLIPAVSDASSEDPADRPQVTAPNAEAPEDRPRRGFRALLRRWIEE